MQVTYFKEWFGEERRPLASLTPDAARRLHERRRPYIAFVEIEGEDLRVVHLTPPWVTVSFLDDQRREWLAYEFREAKPGVLFLKRVVHREFSEQGQQRELKTIRFTEDGHLDIEVWRSGSNEVLSRHDELEVGKNWDAYPGFGDYTGLVQLDRWKEPGGLRRAHGGDEGKAFRSRLHHR